MPLKPVFEMINAVACPIRISSCVDMESNDPIEKIHDNECVIWTGRVPQTKLDFRQRRRAPGKR